MKVLEIEGLGKEFSTKKGSKFRVLDSISFFIEKGQSFGLVGGSGAGKTTLALCILRLVAPGTGKIRFLGENWLALQGGRLRAARRRLQPIFQDPDSSLNPLFRIEYAIREPLIIHDIGDRVEQREKVEWLARKVGLSKADLGRFPRELSGGQRQRVAIARALAPEPDLIIADEPVSSLDTTTQAQIMELLNEIKSELGLTSLFISHDLALVASFCDVVGVICQGRLIEVAKTRELFRNPLHAHTQALLDAARFRTVDVVQSPFDLQEKVLREVHPGHWAAC